MPSMTHVPSDLQQEGPVLEIQFMVPASIEKLLIAENRPIPDPVSVTALIDTGASNCVVQEDIPKNLGLNPISSTLVHTSSSKDNRANVYFKKHDHLTYKSLATRGTTLYVDMTE